MRTLHVAGPALVAVLISGVIAMPASAAEWLANGTAIATSLAAVTTGELELGNANSLFGLKTAVLCSGMSIDTLGPGAEGAITEYLSLTGESIALGKEVNCENKEGCERPRLAPEGLPWKTKLSATGTEFFDAIEGGSWSISCSTIFGPIEETCVGSGAPAVENDAVEKDVLGAFKLEEIATCSGNSTKTGWVSTQNDGPGLLALRSGEELTVS